MQRFLATAGLTVALACSPGAPSSILEGQELVSRMVPPGTPIAAARRALAEAGVSYSDVSVQDTNPFFMEPKFAGRGGPAIWAELNGSVRPWNPFYSPSLHAFLAFSESEVLVSSVVSLEGGDQ